MTHPWVFILFLFAASCTREGSTPPPAHQSSSTVVDALRTDLRTIMTAQERHFSETGSYAATLDLLRAGRTVELSAGGAVELVGAPNRFTVSISKSVGAGASINCRVSVGNGLDTDGLIECR